MIIFRERGFSSKKKESHGLEKYRKLGPTEIAKMTEGQRLRALEVERARATRNTDHISGPWKAAGSVAGALTGGALGYKTSGVAGAATGAVSGSLLGYAGGKYVGGRRAAKEGHDPDWRTRKLARKMDRVARKHGEPDTYEYRVTTGNTLRRVEDNTKDIKDNTVL